MCERPFGLADILDGDLSLRWQSGRTKLPDYFKRIGLTRSDFSQSLYIMPVGASNSAQFVQTLHKNQLDDGAQWVTLIGSHSDKRPLLIAFPASGKAHIYSENPLTRLRNDLALRERLGEYDNQRQDEKHSRVPLRLNSSAWRQPYFH
jgi:hypothetical protein